MGLLRACADAVVLGAGTLRATPGHLWTPAHVYPALATEFIALRSALGRSAEPALVLLTAKGELDFGHPALKRGAIVMTTSAGEKKIGGRLPATCELVVLAKGKSIDIRRAVIEMRDRGLDVLLSQETGLPIHVDEDPLTCVVRGCGRILDDEAKYWSVLAT